MIWTKCKPTCAGWFWYREHGHATIVKVAPDIMYLDHPLRAQFAEPPPAGDCIRVDDLDGDWQGPLQPNEE